MKSEFENSIKRSASYEKLVYQHGERLFIFDDGKYKIAAVQLAWELWEKQQSKVDELQKRVDAALKLIPSLKSENDLWGCEQVERQIELLEQALKGGSTPNLNTDENGECRHFSTTMFADGKAECFQCDAVVNEQREVIGKQSKDLHPFFKREPK